MSIVNPYCVYVPTAGPIEVRDERKPKGEQTVKTFGSEHTALGYARGRWDGERVNAKEWFVYSDTSYYPYAEIVEAETAEEAAEIVRVGVDEPIVALPLSIAFVLNKDAEYDLIAALREAGADSKKLYIERKRAS